MATYAFFEPIAKPTVVNDGQNGRGRGRQVFESVHQYEVQNNVVEGDGLDATKLHFGGQFESLALVLNENHHGVVGVKDVARVLVGQCQQIGQQRTTGRYEPLLGTR